MHRNFELLFPPSVTDLQLLFFLLLLPLLVLLLLLLLFLLPPSTPAAVSQCIHLFCCRRFLCIFYVCCILLRACCASSLPTPIAPSPTLPLSFPLPSLDVLHWHAHFKALFDSFVVSVNNLSICNAYALRFCILMTFPHRHRYLHHSCLPFAAIQRY